MANSHSSGSPLPGIFLGKWGAEVSHLPALPRVMIELVIGCAEQ